MAIETLDKLHGTSLLFFSRGIPSPFEFDLPIDAIFQKQSAATAR